MASPYLFYEDLLSISANGGYTESPELSQLSAVFLLSACTYLKERWLWQNPSYPISDATYQQIIFMIEETEKQLMLSDQIGKIISSVNEAVPDGYLALDGTSVLIADYQLLADAVPASWKDATNINLPDLSGVSVIGTQDGLLTGGFVGENEVVLTEAELASHTHVQQPHAHGYSVAVPVTALGGEIPATASIVTVAPAVTGVETAINQDAGNNEAHNNISLSLSVNYFVKAS